MQAIALPLLISAAMMAGFSLTGCRPRSQQTETDQRRLLMVVSGDTQGWIVPCGCTTNQSGGLLRRGDYLKQLASSADVIYVDAGGAASGTPAYDQAKFAAILAGESLLDVAAHNIGAAEAKLGPSKLRQIAAETGVPLVSANARDSQGEPIAPAYRLIRAAGRRVLVIGVLSKSFQTPELRVRAPQPEILKLLEQTAGKRDYVVLLAYLPEDELRTLTARLPEVDAVVGGPTGQAIAPQSLGPTLLAAATNKGKFLVELEFPAKASSARVSGSVVELNDRFADDPTQQNNLAALYQLLAQRDFTPEQTSFAPLKINADKDHQIAGTASCRDCHQEECDLWDNSSHAHAWDTLESEGAHVDSYCQQCHTTGYGVAGGFRSVQRTKQQVNVGCESCHGPSAAHVENPSRHTAFYQTAAGQCVACHDRENSPQFDYESYWAQIRHGQPATDINTNPVGSGAQP